MLKRYEIMRNSKWLAILNFLLASFIIYSLNSVVVYYFADELKHEQAAPYVVRVVANSNLPQDLAEKEQLAKEVERQMQQLSVKPVKEAAHLCICICSNVIHRRMYKLSSVRSSYHRKSWITDFIHREKQKRLSLKSGKDVETIGFVLYTLIAVSLNFLRRKRKSLYENRCSSDYGSVLLRRSK